MINGYLKNTLKIICVLACTTALTSCAQQQKEPKNIIPTGYDLSNPKKYNMPEALLEISGFAFHNGDTSNVYAQQDEEGKIFSLKLGVKKHADTKFAKNGDYEDIAIAWDKVIVLKSNGNLYTFPFSELGKKHAENVTETKSILPKGEYEGIFADAKANKLYVLCKECKQDANQKITSGFVLELQPDNQFKLVSEFKIDVSNLDKLSGRKKGTFHPSALAKNQTTNDWYIVSAINKVLIITDSSWKVKGSYHLSSNIFGQPEGIAFDKYNNLYISNEGSDTQYGNILKFVYQKQRN